MYYNLRPSIFRQERLTCKMQELDEKVVKVIRSYPTVLQDKLDFIILTCCQVD